MDHFPSHLFSAIVNLTPESRTPAWGACSDTLFCTVYVHNPSVPLFSYGALSNHRWHAPQLQNHPSSDTIGTDTVPSSRPSSPLAKPTSVMHNVIKERLGIGLAGATHECSFARAVATNNVGMCEFLKNWGLSLQEARARRFTFGTAFNPRGFTYSPLQTAAWHGSLGVCRFLKEWGFTLQDVRENDCLALTMAAQNGDAPTYIFIRDWKDSNLERLTQTQIKDASESAIFLACQRGKLETCKLIRFECKANLGCVQGNRAFNEAAANGHVDLLNFLQKWMSSCKHKISKPWPTTLHLVSKNGHVDVLKLFKEQYDLCLDDVRARQTKILRVASKYGHLNILHFLKDNFPLIKEDVCARQNYALRKAAKNGRLSVLKFLKEWNLDKNDLHAKENYAFCRAAKYGHLEILNFLWNWGRHSLGARNSYAVRAAAEHGHLHVIRFLKNHGLTTENVRDLKNDALCKALSNGHLEICQFLKDEFHLTLDDAREVMLAPNTLPDIARNGRFNVMHWLKNWNNRHNKPEVWQNNKPDIPLSCVGQSCLNINDFTHAANRALVSAAMYGHLNICQLLKEWGLILTMDGDSRGNEALRMAAHNGHLSVCQFLLDWGAIPVGRMGNQFLVGPATNGYLDILKLLKQYGAPHTLVSNNVIVQSAHNGHLQVTRFLCDWVLENTGKQN